MEIRIRLRNKRWLFVEKLTLSNYLILQEKKSRCQAVFLRIKLWFFCSLRWSPSEETLCIFQAVYISGISWKFSKYYKTEGCYKSLVIDCVYKINNRRRMMIEREICFFLWQPTPNRVRDDIYDDFSKIYQNFDKTSIIYPVLTHWWLVRARDDRKG